MYRTWGGWKWSYSPILCRKQQRISGGLVRGEEGSSGGIESFSFHLNKTMHVHRYLKSKKKMIKKRIKRRLSRLLDIMIIWTIGLLIPTIQPCKLEAVRGAVLYSNLCLLTSWWYTRSVIGHRYWTATVSLPSDRPGIVQWYKEEFSYS